MSSSSVSQSRARRFGVGWVRMKDGKFQNKSYVIPMRLITLPLITSRKDFQY